MATIIFIFSLFGLVLLFGSKAFELKVKQIDFLTNLFTRGDEKIHSWAEIANTKYQLYKKIVHIFIFDFLPSYAYELTVKLKDYVSKKYYSAGNGFRGRRVLRSDGSVSSFLKQITDERPEVIESKKA